MTILRLCDQESATVPPESTVAEAIRLMLARRVGAVVVVDANRVVGIFTERDVLKKLALSGRDPEKRFGAKKKPCATARLRLHYGLSYLALALGFIFPCAQRCFINRDIFLRAAALMRRRRLGFAEV